MGRRGAEASSTPKNGGKLRNSLAMAWLHGSRWFIAGVGHRGTPRVRALSLRREYDSRFGDGVGPQDERRCSVSR